MKDFLLTVWAAVSTVITLAPIAAAALATIAVFAERSLRKEDRR